MVAAEAKPIAIKDAMVKYIVSVVEGDWRRRTWHPDTQSNFTSSRLNVVTTPNQYQPQPQVYQYPPPPPPPPPKAGYSSYGDKNGGYGKYGSYGAYKKDLTDVLAAAAYYLE